MHLLIQYFTLLFPTARCFLSSVPIDPPFSGLFPSPSALLHLQCALAFELYLLDQVSSNRTVTSHSPPGCSTFTVIDLEYTVITPIGNFNSLNPSTLSTPTMPRAASSYWKARWKVFTCKRALGRHGDLQLLPLPSSYRQLHTPFGDKNFHY